MDHWLEAVEGEIEEAESPGVREEGRAGEYSILNGGG